VAVLSVQLGAAVAKSLFDNLTPTGVRRPSLHLRRLRPRLALPPAIRNRPRASFGSQSQFGLVLVTMNFCFYQAIDRIPLGIAVTLEFVGPLGIALLGSRRVTDLLWVSLAAAGIVLLAPGIGEDGLDAVESRSRSARACSGPLTSRSASASAARTPGPPASCSRWQWEPSSRFRSGSPAPGRRCSSRSFSPRRSPSPSSRRRFRWSLELEALRRLPAHVFGVLMSLEPAIGALVGFFVLGERLGARAVVAIALVVIASAGAARGAVTGLAPRDV
jgi:inner membrane transporter RhtA